MTLKFSKNIGLFCKISLNLNLFNASVGLDWFQIGKGVRQGFLPLACRKTCLFLYGDFYFCDFPKCTYLF